MKTRSKTPCKKLFLFALCSIFAKAAFCQIELRNVSDAVKIALANDVERNLQRQSAEESLRIAKKNIVPFLPVLDFAITDAARAQKDIDDSKNKSIEVGVTQKIFNGGKSLLEWQMQKEQGFYQCLSVQKSYETFQIEIIKSYYNALILKLKSELLEKNVENAKTYLLLSELEEAEGMITKTDYLETLLKYKKMELEAKTARDDYENAETLLKNLMNLDRCNTLLLLESEKFEACLTNFITLKNLKEKSQEYKQSAVQNSLNLKLSLAELNWAKKTRAIQKRIFLPSVSVRGAVAFNGRNYPLTSPTYSVNVILSFEDNPWIGASINRQHGFNKGKLNSLADSFSGKGIANTIYFNQLKLSKIDLNQKKLGYEKTKKQIEENVTDRMQKIEQAQENFLLGLENVKIKEQKLLLSKLQLDQGKIKKSDYLEEMSECAKEKIQCLSLLKERDFMIKELETIVERKF